MPRRLRIFATMLLGLFAASPSFAASLEESVLAEINYVRAHPREYADELRRYRDRFDGRIAEDESGRYMTYEGTRAVDEAIRFLESQQPLAPLGHGTLLARAAEDHAVEQGRRGSMGHISANGMTPSRRVVQRGGGAYVSETISYGYSNAQWVVRSLIVDDGVSSRMHRTIIFMSFLRYAGVGCAPHATSNYECVIDYSATVDGRAVPPTRLARADIAADDDRQPF